MSDLLELASQARWFPSGEVRLEGADLLLEVPVDDDPVQFWVLRVHSAHGELSYQMITHRGRDATTEPDLVAQWLPVVARHPAWRAHEALPQLGPGFVYGGEQTNTSVFLPPVICKIFRGLQPGINIDAEIHAALSDTGLVAPLYGALTAAGMDLLLVLGALPDPTDGFVLARDHAASGADFSEHACALGRRMRALHSALATRLPTGTGTSRTVIEDANQQLQAALREVAELAPWEDTLRRRIAQLPDVPITIQRIHGDAHLGQVLLSHDVWYWVDFEGEPLRPLQERRAPDHPLRDVAGMLRSLSYAGASAASPEWEATARRAFLAGYGELTSQEMAILDAYELAKTIYEVRYEARHRPSWLRIPMTALGHDRLG